MGKLVSILYAILSLIIAYTFSSHYEIPAKIKEFPLSDKVYCSFGLFLMAAVYLVVSWRYVFKPVWKKHSHG
jgi:hypothetical protein